MFLSLLVAILGLLWRLLRAVSEARAQAISPHMSVTAYSRLRYQLRQEYILEVVFCDNAVNSRRLQDKNPGLDYWQTEKLSSIPVLDDNAAKCRLGPDQTRIGRNTGLRCWCLYRLVKRYLHPRP